jgi:hypothetical protein
MLRFLPQKRDFRWLYWGIAYTIVVWGCLVLNRYMVLNSALEFIIVLRILLLAIFIAAFVNLAGYFGARWIWLGSSLGIACGILFMMINSGNQTGWEDLISFLTFLMLSAIGIGAGIILECFAALIRLLRQRG